MALSKIQSESVNLADNFAFTGTVSGAGGGKTLQMVRAALTPRLAGSVTAGTYIDTGLTASITPASTGSKILVFSRIGMNATVSTYHYNRAVRSIGGGSYAVPTGSNQYGQAVEYKAGSEWTSLDTAFIDEPATTSAITYKVQYTAHSNATWNYGWNGSGGADNMNALILIEIGA
jgi:hypothetical protein